MILPGSTVGILGGGQLARMSAMAARRMGYRVAVFESPGADAPASPVCDKTVRAEFDDADALREFARAVDVITLEFENIPAAALQALETPVHPDWSVLHVCQHREREKLFLQRAGYPHARFRVVQSLRDLESAARSLGTPCVLKTSEMGYDGKGQIKINADTNLSAAWQDWTQGREAPRGIVEAWVDFAAELSVICARNGRGQMEAIPAMENIHSRHILDLSVGPGRFSLGIVKAAEDLARGITEALGVIGLLAVEMFLTRAGDLLVNELAPRPHNSGHLTLDAGMTSQFEQHVRAVCGLPLGCPDLLCPAVMLNLLGDLWPRNGRGQPDWTPVLTEPAAKLHLYGKSQARPGRKMGHVCVLDRSSADNALANAKEIKKRLSS